jgi:uncharacterized protein
VAMRPPAGVPALSRRTRILLILAAIVVVVLLAGSRLVNLYVDYLWFGEVKFRSVFSTVLFTNVLLFVVGGLLIGGLVALSLWIAYRSRPVFVPVSGPEDPVARYRTVIIQRLRLFGIGIPVVVGLIAGLTATGNWQLVQLFLNSTPFGATDPVNGIDIGFYTFQLPFYRWVLGWLFAGVTISFIAALITHYVFGGIRLAGRAGQVSGAARAQLAILAGIFVLLKAVAYFFDRFDLLFSDRAAPTFNGATYTDLNAVMPAKLILLFISIVCAAAFFAAVFRRNLQLPAIATILLILSSVLIGAAWPQVLQQFVVAPNAIDRESVPIQRNIEATRAAFGVGPDKVTSVDYKGTSNATPQQVASDKATIPNIRLLDPAKVSATFTQLRQGRSFYGFSPKLDIDRYTENNGDIQDYIVAARELNAGGLSGNQTDWINQHLVYTHGNGLVVAPADKINQPLTDDTNTQGGLPIFTNVDVASVSTQASLASIPKSLQTAQPRIYYGELFAGSDDYSIVGGQSGATPREYDGDNQSYTYTGSGGVPIGDLFTRTIFALKYQERNILFNNSINPDSKIMYVRQPEARVEAVAPWLTTDSDPYPAVVDGKLTWIVDGYTTLKQYPYATPVPFGATTTDAQQTAQPGQQNQNISYLRNSVKATVDAYTGAVTLYAFDDTDPVLKTWEKAFPGTVRPSSEISTNLRAHFRYPEDQFKVQRELLTRYHVENPTQFFGGASFWDVPEDPTVQAGASTGAQPPYYVLAGAPGDPNATAPKFQLTSALVFRSRQILASYMSASSDPDTYGKITVLQLPAETQTLGPQQVQSQLVGTPNVASALGLLSRSNQSSIDYGNLLTLPVAGGLLYVEPVYVERTGQSSSYPQLARVLVYSSVNQKIGFAPSLQSALEQVFGPGSGQNASGGGGGTTPTPPTGTPTPPGANNPQLVAAAAAIQTAITQVRTAQTSGDLGQLGTALTALDKAVKDYQQLNGQTPGG